MSQIIYSSDLSTYITFNKDKMVKGSLEKAAIFSRKVARPDVYVAGLEDALALSNVVLPKPWVWTSVEKVRIFSGTEAEVSEILQNLPRKKVVETPEKVLVKMLALRFQKIRRSVKQLANAGYGELLNVNYPDFKTVEELESFFMDGPGEKELCRYYDARRRIEDLLEVIKEKRGTLSNEVIAEAWNMDEVREVMES